MNRRNFIDRTGRTLLLGAIALLSGLLVARRQVVQHSTCTDKSQCRNCRKLAECRLPEAETERTNG